MFTGIIEEVGKIVSIEKIQENVHFKINCSFLNELKVDQSIAHNGVCLTVSSIDEICFEVVAVSETLSKSNLGSLKKGDFINLERCMKLNQRIDGHMVQGHVDSQAEIIQVIDNKGSTNFTFRLPEDNGLIVEKGSITINGVSLTTFNVDKNKFSVTIIPYTFENTTFKTLRLGDKVNIEYDIIGKYVQKMLSKNFSSN